MAGGEFFDEALIYVRAGAGGNGSVSFRREKFVPFGGPDGGDGGRGGSVYLRATTGLNTLQPFRYDRRFLAGDGLDGTGKRRHGKKGIDKYINVPLGTVVRASTEEGDIEGIVADLIEPGQEVQIARGGRGGLGNSHFATSTHQTPRFAQKGEPGQELWLKLELKLIADVGLLGYPNVGKSTFLATVTAANPKIGDYPFTTLVPNLGVVEIDDQNFVIADIPGLIEGAHRGVGLGHDFLRHIERTRILVHLLDGTSENPVDDYKRLNRELELYDPKLSKKKQFVVITKTDITEVQDRLPELVRDLEKESGGQVFPISSVSGDGVQALLRAVWIAVQAAEPPEPQVVTPIEMTDDSEEALPVIRPTADSSRGHFEIIRHGRRTFEISGHQVERMVTMTYLPNDEGFRFLLRMLDRLGVQKALIAADVPEGAKVTVAQDEFVWNGRDLELPPPPVRKPRSGPRRRIDA